MADSQPPLNHIGFIVDGNRRWASENSKSSLEGHRQGAERLKEIAKHCNKIGIPYVSAYVFSTENWSRSSKEVKYLMNLFIEFVERDIDELHQENVKLVHIGSRDNVPVKVLEALDRAVEKTADNTGAVFGFCFNYGGHKEIVDATKAIIDSEIDSSKVTEELIGSYLYAPEIPPLDLVVRTSGEQRLSNFMMWRSSYSELYFTDTYWPDFDEAGLDKALEWYSERQRRFGGN